LPEHQFAVNHSWLSTGIELVFAFSHPRC